MSENERSNINEIRIIQTDNIKIRSPYIIIGLPDVGLVGTIATSYLIDTLEMKEIGYVDSDLFHPLVIVRDNEVKYPIRLYSNKGFVVAFSDLPITPSIVIPFSKVLIDWSKRLNPKMVINITGLPTQNRMSIEKPDVLCLATESSMIEKLRSEGLSLFSNGVIMGTYASVIKECMKQHLPCLTLLVQSYANFPDPTASIAALSITNQILGSNIDLSRLEKEAEMIRVRTRELMKQTESAMTQSKVSGTPTIYG